MSKKKNFRIAVISAIAVFSFLSWWILKNSLWSDGDWLARILAPFVSFLILSVAAGIFFISEADKRWLAAVPAIIFVSFLLVFVNQSVFLLDWGAWLVILLSAGFMSLSIIYLDKEKNSRIKLSFSSVLRSGLRYIFMAIALLASLGFYYSPPAQADIEQIVIPRNSFDKIINPILKSTDFNFSGKLSAIWPSASPSYFFSFNNDSVQIKLMESEREKINREIGDKIYQSANQMINNLGRPYKKFFSLGLTVSFFFALKILQVLLMWLAIILSFGIFKLLEKSGILSIRNISAQKETVEI